MTKELPAIPRDLAPGGVVRTSTLLGVGFGSDDVRAAIRAGQLVRVARGWLAAQESDQKVAEAVQAGGILGCASAITFHGGWDLNDGKLHLYCSQRERRRTTSVKAAGSARVQICPSPRCRQSYQVAVLPLSDALIQAGFCLHPYDFLVQAESLIQCRKMAADEVRATMAGINSRIDRMMQKLDISESGIETMVRLRLRGKGIKLTPQVPIPEVGHRVDFLIGTRLVIEVDGAEHHGSKEAFEHDRSRDLDLSALGYHVVRVTYRQVMYEWASVEAKVLQMVRMGLHTQPLPRRAF